MPGATDSPEAPAPPSADSSDGGSGSTDAAGRSSDGPEGPTADAGSSSGSTWDRDGGGGGNGQAGGGGGGSGASNSGGSTTAGSPSQSPGGSSDGDGRTADIVVAKSGSGDFTSISTAVAHADAGDVIYVVPATYVERVAIAKDITLRSDGARLVAPNRSAAGFVLTAADGSKMSPEISGFQLVGQRVGVVGPETGCWTLRNMMISDIVTGIDGRYTRANATLVNVTVENASKAGVDGGHSTGDWTIRTSRFYRASFRYDSGAITADGSAGEWLIQNTTMAASMYGLAAEEVTGAIRVTDSIIVNNTMADVITSDDSDVTASGDYWGDGAVCRGAVDCSGALATVPYTPRGPLRPAPANPATVTLTATEGPETTMVTVGLDGIAATDRVESIVMHVTAQGGQFTNSPIVFHQPRVSSAWSGTSSERTVQATFEGETGPVTLFSLNVTATDPDALTVSVEPELVTTNRSRYVADNQSVSVP